MPGESDSQLVAARSVLLDALQALQGHIDALIALACSPGPRQPQKASVISAQG
jgi:hypothetical protein